jgi:hypothetical protein
VIHTSDVLFESARLLFVDFEVEVKADLCARSKITRDCVDILKKLVKSARQRPGYTFAGNVHLGGCRGLVYLVETENQRLQVMQQIG